MFEKHNLTESREKRADLLMRFLSSAENIEALHDKKLEEVLGTEQELRKFISNLSKEEFVDLLNGINGILRNKNKTEWKMDGDTVQLESAFLGTGYVPPRHEDKEDLLQNLLSAEQRMSAQGRSQEDLAILAAVGINDIHAYADGNGRTGRFIYTLVNNGFNIKNQEMLKEILGDEGRDSINLDMTHLDVAVEKLIIDNEFRNSEANPLKITNIFYEQPLNLDFQEGTDKKLVESFTNAVKNDSFYALLALFRFLKSQPDYKKYTKQFPPGDDFERSALILDTLAPDLSQENLKEILDSYWKLKKEHVNKVIDFIENPNKPEYQTDFENQHVSLLDYLKLKLKRSKPG